MVGLTVSVTTIECELGAVSNLNRLLDSLAPRDGHGSNHVRAELLGHSLTSPLFGERLMIGTWQWIILLECDIRPQRLSFVA